jgi:hypothetical protein
VVDPTLSPSAMTFVWDPEGVSEMLYGLVEGVLVVVHPATFVRTPIGKLALEDVRGLAGTGDGRLVAFAGDLVVTIAYVALGDASLKSTWQIKSPEPTRGRFVGGVVTESGFDLVFGANVYTYDPVKGSLGRPTPLFPQDPGVIAVSAAPCTPGPK